MCRTKKETRLFPEKVSRSFFVLTQKRNIADGKRDGLENTNFLINFIFVLLEEIKKLKSENAALEEEKADLETMMEMSSEHADEIGAELLDKVDETIKEIEERVRLISETIPVPIVIAQVSDGKILYINEHSCSVFGFEADEFLKYNVSELYENPADGKLFLNLLSEERGVNNFEVRLKKADGTMLWAALFSKRLDFKDRPSILMVIYDLTERRKAEEEIRRLNEELNRANEREGKYLMFTLASQEYGIDILKIREIIGMMPVTPVPGVSDFVKGVMNLRGRVIPVADLRLRFGIEAADYTDRTCIIVVELENDTKKTTMIGIIVDSVTEVLGIKGKAIEAPPELVQNTDARFISGMAKAGGSVKIMLDISNFWSGCLMFDV